MVTVSGVRRCQSGGLGSLARADPGHLLAGKWTGRTQRPVQFAEFSLCGSTLSDAAFTPFPWPWSSKPAYAILLGHGTLVLIFAS